MKHLRLVHQLIWSYKWHFIAGLCLVVLTNFFRVLQPGILRQALDLVLFNVTTVKLLTGFELRDTFLLHLGKTVMLFGIIMLLLALCMGLFMYLMRQMLVVMSRLIEYDLRKIMFDQYETLDTAFYRRNKTGDLMARISEDVAKVRMYTGPGIMYSINIVAMVILVVFSMLKVNAVLTFYSLASLPFLSVSIFLVSKMIERRSSAIQKQLSVLNVQAQESYSGIRTLKSFARIPSGVKTFGVATEQYRFLGLKLALVDGLFSPLVLLLIGVSTIATVYMGGVQVIKGEITPGNIAEFVIYIYMLTWPVTSVGWIASLTQQAIVSMKRINEFLDARPLVIPTIAAGALQLKGEIEFKNVRFVYPDSGIEALKAVSFSIQPGQKVALVGKTGSGKTTIAELALRLYDTTEGQILLDGRPIKTLDTAQLRQRIAYVPQDVFLFSDSVSANIAFGVPDADQATIAQFAKHAAIDKDIRDLPKGYETIVGERGVMLSGGQKQRISIARALIKQADILILDDCLSAVDNQTEKEIFDYFNRELADTTLLMITHRVGGLEHFDHIIVLENGKIVQQGTPSSLLAAGGYFASQWEVATSH